TCGEVLRFLAILTAERHGNGRGPGGERLAAHVDAGGMLLIQDRVEIRAVDESQTGGIGRAGGIRPEDVHGHAAFREWIGRRAGLPGPADDLVADRIDDRVGRKVPEYRREIVREIAAELVLAIGIMSVITPGPAQRALDADGAVRRLVL